MKENENEELGDKNNGNNKDNQENKIIEGNVVEEEEENIIIKRNLAENTEYERSIKVIVLGDSSVGKSTLINRLKSKEIMNISATLSIEYHTYITSLNNYFIRMQIWDTAGQEKFSSIVSNYYKGTEVAIFIYSIDSKLSFNNTVVWFNNLKENSAEKSLNILLGNKRDLEKEKREVTYEEGEKFATDNDFFLFREISCKGFDEKEEKEELENIMEIFDEIGKYFYNNDKLKKRTVSEDLDYKASDSMIAIGVKQRKKQTETKKTCCFN